MMTSDEHWYEVAHRIRCFSLFLWELSYGACPFSAAVDLHEAACK